MVPHGAILVIDTQQVHFGPGNEAGGFSPTAYTDRPCAASFMGTDRHLVFATLRLVTLFLCHCYCYLTKFFQGGADSLRVDATTQWNAVNFAARLIGPKAQERHLLAVSLTNTARV